MHETCTYTGDEQRNDIETVLLKFRTYCEPRKNIVFERYQFWNRNQNASEPIDQWVTDLRSKAAKCEFGTFESDMIRDKVVFGVRDERIKERLLREADLTLNKALDVCRAAETSTQQIEAMGVTQTQALSVHTMQARKKVIITVRQYACQSSRAPTNVSTPIHRLVNIVGNRMRHVSVQRMASCVESVADRIISRLYVWGGGVVWHAALPLVDLCTLSRVAIPAGYSSVQYMSVKSIAVGGTLTCL